jgi:hypothetical protein
MSTKASTAIDFSGGEIFVPPTDHTADIAQLSESVCEMGRPYARQDLAKLDELSAPDYVQTDTRGGVLKRAEYLEFVRNRKSKLSIECDNIEVRLYGEAAVVIGGWTYTTPSSAPRAT